jgi:ATP-dependent Lon protease
MSAYDELSLKPDEFSGKARLFPLPNLVLFPHVLQPVHIFEPRYRELLEDALDGDGLIAMALLAPGWETDYEGRPPVCPVACLGRVATYQRLEEGRYNLLLAGLKRVGIVRELPPTKSFREAEVELYEDQYPPASTAARPQLQRSLLKQFKRVLPKMPETSDQLKQLLESDISLGMLTDLVSYTLDLELACKEQLLRQCDVDRRAELLVSQLAKVPSGTMVAGRRPGAFPPDFSAN